MVKPKPKPKPRKRVAPKRRKPGRRADDKAIEALRAQTERLLLGQAAAGMIVMDWDIQRDIVTWSDSPEWLRGPLPASGKYPLYKDQVHPEDRRNFLDVRQRSIETSSYHDNEYRLVRTDGRVLWVLTHGISVAGADGKAARMLVAILDITERKAVSLELAESEARFRAVAELSLDWYWEQDAELRFVSFIGGSTPHAGIVMDDQVGRTRWEIPGTEVAGGTWDAHRADLAARRPFRDLLLKRTAADGSIFYVYASGAPIFDARGEFTGYRGVGRDVTDRVRAEINVRAADERLRAAINGLNEPVAVTDAEDRIVMVNRYFQELNGNTRLVDPGRLYEEHLRAGIRIGNYPAATGRVEGWLRERLAARRRGGTIEVQRQDGKWLQCTDQRLPDGGTITFALDITARKCAERALQESEARFRDFAGASGDWFWETDTEDRFVWISESVERFAGWPPEYFIGKTRSEVAAAAGVDIEGAAWRTMMEAIARREPFRDARHDRTGGHGRRIWVNVSGVPRHDAEGRFAGYRGAVCSITGQVENERRVREADERLRAAIENLSEAISVTDAEDRIVVTNRAFREMNRHEPGFLESKPTYEAHLRWALATRLVPAAVGREEEWLRERLAQRRRGGAFESRRDTGIWLHVTERRLPDGGTVAFALDITERKRAEAVLRASEQRYRALVELSSDFYWQTDTEHRFVLRQGKILADMGLDPAGDYGKTRWELDFMMPDEAGWREHRAVLARREVFRDLRTARRGGDGRLFCASVSGKPLTDAAGAFIGYHGIARDITAEVGAEQALRDMNTGLELRVAERTAELQAAYQELESFSYSVSHDLRAPLRAISGFAGILREEESGKLSADGLRHLSVIDANAQQMGRLVDALLELVRMSRHAIAGSRLDMGAIAREAATLVGSEFPRARIEIGSMPAARGDATLVRQVYVNLIGNALKYSSQKASPRVEVGAEDGDDGLLYFVRDNGVGFDMAYANKLFKPFERLHADPEFKGTGIGLALASLIVRRHGGRIGAESAPGKGATFRFTLGAG